MSELREGLAKALYEAFAARMGRPDQKWEDATIQARDSFGADADTCLVYLHVANAELQSRLDTAENALLHHGYRKSCGIAACNCGDQWNHGGHAVARLDEIASATQDHYRNGELLRTRIERLMAAADSHAEFVRAVREIAERAVIRHGSGLGESLGTLNIITALCDAELAKEMSK